MKLNIKLSAYSKGIFPDLTEYVKDAPIDDETYARKNGDWVTLDEIANKVVIKAEDNSSIKVDADETGDLYTVGLKEVYTLGLPAVYEDNTTYYTRDVYGKSLGIYRKIDGIVARLDNSFELDELSHNTLLNREYENAHPIESITGLKDKLDTADVSLEDLKKKTEALETTQQTIKDDLDTNTTNSKQIAMRVAGQEVTFTDYDGETTTFKSGSQVDDITIKQTDETKLEAVALRIDATATITGSEIKSKLTDLASETDINALEISSLEAYNKTQDDNLTALSNKVNAQSGLGGYLTANDFGKATPTQSELTEYALQVIGITNPLDIFSGTRVKNLFDNEIWILTNTQDTDPTVFEWSDNGQDIISLATNSVTGIVKGSLEQFKATVDINGELSINGLKEELNKINQLKADSGDSYLKEETYSKTETDNNFTSKSTYNMGYSTLDEKITNLRSDMEEDIASAEGRIETVANEQQAHDAEITKIQGVIPTQASITNQLADKAYVDTAIQTSIVDAWGGSY